MNGQRHRKCLGCGALFRADPRNVKHHSGIAAPPARRQASKAASHQDLLDVELAQPDQGDPEPDAT
jgi:hypothetical protein